jgi:hypothetical protein
MTGTLQAAGEAGVEGEEAVWKLGQQLERYPF